MNVLVVAEVGVNHDGKLDRGLRLIDAAVKAGADVVKFQSFRAELLAARAAPSAKYQETKSNQSQFDLLESLELTEKDYWRLSSHCESLGVEFLSTGFDAASIDFLVGLGLKRLKVPSGEITNLPLLRHVGAKGLPVVVSTGMSSLGEVEAALLALEEVGTVRDRVTVLHCTTEYPSPMIEVNLRAMQTIGLALAVAVGYSDHTVGAEVAIAATALGATIIEKHITLDQDLPGPDHSASMEPQDFAEMVKAIRGIQDALGDGIKRATESESLNMAAVRKSLVALRPINKGELFSEANLTSKRPGTGVSPMMWDQFIGRVAQRSYEPDELIEW